MVLRNAIHTLADINGHKSIETVKRWKNIRNEMKKKVITYQKDELLKNMIQMTKPDGGTLNFNFNGNEVCYLKLPLKKARIVLLLRSRMFLTKANFPGRWENGICDFCGGTENDFHLFACPRYMDITDGDLKYETFFNLEQVEWEVLDKGAEKLLKIHERLQTVKELIK